MRRRPSWPNGYVTSVSDVELWRELGQQFRVDSVRAAAAAKSGHPTSSMSAADLMAVLLADHLRYDFDDPDDPNNDQLIFSKGHASPLLYAIFRAAGAIDDDELLTFRQLGSRFEGHPTPVIPWVDVATGSLGQGLPIGVGVALAGKRLDRCPTGCGCLRRQRDGRGLDLGGVRARRLLGLDNLTAIIDVNRLGQRGETMHGWDTRRLRRAGPGLRLARHRDRRPRRRGHREGLRRGRRDDRKPRSSSPGPRRARASRPSRTSRTGTASRSTTPRRRSPSSAASAISVRSRSRTATARRTPSGRRARSSCHATRWARRWPPARPTARRSPRSARPTARWWRSTAR